MVFRAFLAEDADKHGARCFCGGRGVRQKRAADKNREQKLQHREAESRGSRQQLG